MMPIIDVRNLTNEEAQSRGFKNRMEFLVDWIAQHDPETNLRRSKSHPAFWDMTGGVYLRPDSVIDILRSRPVERYQI